MGSRGDTSFPLLRALSILVACSRWMLSGRVGISGGKACVKTRNYYILCIKVRLAALHVVCSLLHLVFRVNEPAAT